MTSFLMALTLACPSVLVVNKSGLAFDSTDREIMINSHNRCAHKYQNSPCLKKFTKRDTRAHMAICGARLGDSRGRVSQR